MSKIYIVVSSSGYYDGYSCWNEKAFLSEEKAKAYAKELDDSHFNKPDFITDEFEQAINDCFELAPEWEKNPYNCSTERYKYLEWIDKQNEKEKQFVINLMCKKGYNITEAMYNSYLEWEDNS